MLSISTSCCCIKFGTTGSGTCCGGLARGRVVMLWEGLLQQKTLFDAVTLDETMSLTWYSSQKLDPGIHLPSRLQSLTFGERFNQSLEGIQLPNSQQPAEFDVCHCAQPEFGGATGSNFIFAGRASDILQRLFVCVRATGIVAG
ncbi:unnamed protein product, partial [Symbiodinium sp. KB8]